MKLNSPCALIALIILSLSASAQTIRNKEEFIKNFIAIFNQRETGFDSLKAKSWEDDQATILKLPGATESYISDNQVYGAMYRDADSLKVLGLYREIKQLLGQVAAYYKAEVKFVPFYADQPYYERFIFADANLFTNEGSNISFSKAIPASRNEDDEEDEDDKPVTKKEAPRDSFDVLLLIRPGNSLCHFTSAGSKLQDPEVKQFISEVALGNDQGWNSIKLNKRMEKDVAVYDSKIKLKGFRTEIRERTVNKKTNRAMYLSRIYTGDEDSFKRSADSLVFKVKTALPAGYCYEISSDEEGIYISFKPVPFQTTPANPASIDFTYSAVEGKKDTYQLEIRVSK